MIDFSKPHRPSISAYTDGCRCPGCKTACRDATRRRRARERRAAGANVSCPICDALFFSAGSRDRHEAMVHRSVT